MDQPNPIHYEAVQNRLYNIYQRKIPMYSSSPDPVPFSGYLYGSGDPVYHEELCGSGWIDQPGDKYYIDNDGYNTLSYDNWAEMVSRQLAATNANVIPQIPEEEKDIRSKLKTALDQLKDNPDDPDLNAKVKKIVSEFQNMLKRKGGKRPKGDRALILRNVAEKLFKKMKKHGGHSNDDIAKVFVDGFERSGGSMKDLHYMLKKEPHVYDEYEFY